MKPFNFKILSFAILLGAGHAATAQAVFSGSGNANSTAALNNFRTAIGGINNGGAGGPKSSGRREINWDAVKLDGTDFGGNSTVIVPGKTVNIPTNRFAARGATFDEPYAVSGDGFASANPLAVSQFPSFSPSNTFGMANDNGIEMSFNLAGTATAAATTAFGAVFLDVEQASASSIEFFNGATSLGKYFVATAGSGEANFLGVQFGSAVITRVSLVLGTSTLFNFDGTTVTAGGPDDFAAGHDLVATDDFIYAEPAPEPGAVFGLVTGFLALALRRRK